MSVQAVPTLSQVPVSAVSPERFRALVGKDYALVEKAAATAGRVLAGRTVWHINSTARGGGVAEMLQSLLAYARGVGVDVRWLTINGDPDFFRITKRLHNHLHASAGDGGDLGASEREVYERWLLEAANELVRLIPAGDVVYVHDPQPAGLIPHIKSTGARVVWRCHVGVDQPNPLTRAAWDFLRPYVDEADAYVFSRREFVWDGLETSRIWLVPPSIDAFSPKNQELDEAAVQAILNKIGLGGHDHFQNALFAREDGSTARVNRRAELDQEGPIPDDAQLIVQVSRWDRLKDPAGLLRCFAEHVRNPHAHLLMAGPAVEGVTDDPEGADVLTDVRALREELPADVRGRVHLASLPIDDLQENGAMVNAIQRRAEVVVQKSLAEGFGLTVAEAMWKAKPVVATRVGGIQDQIVDGESGLLVDDPTDLQAVGAAINRLLDDPNRARAMGVSARERIRASFLGTRHLAQYMELIERMLRLDGQRSG